MADRQETPPTPLGIYDKSQKERVTGIEITALVLSLLWLGLVAVLFLFFDTGNLFDEAGGPVWFILVMLAVFMPVAMIWVAATAARSSRVMREESQRLQGAIDAIRHSYIVQNQSGKTVS